MAKPIKPDVVYHLKTVADPSLSADGARLAYTLSWVDQKTVEARSRITMIELADGRTTEFTQGDKDTSPECSPDGSLLAFLRADEGGKHQVWLMSTYGGEAWQLTQQSGDVREFSWSPDSKHIALSAVVDPDASLDSDESPPGPRVRVVRRIRYRYDTIGWRGDSHFHMFVVDVSSGTVRQLTDGDWDDTTPVWSPDGSRIAFISGRRDDSDITALTEVYVVAASEGEPEMWSEGLSSVGAVAWSPDGQKLVAVGSEAPEGMVQWQGWLYVLEPGKRPRRLTDDSVKPYVGFPPVTRPSELRWTGHDRVIFLGEIRGESFIFEVPADGGPVQSIAGGRCQSTALTLDGEAKTAVVVSTSPDSPSDLHHIDLGAGAAKELTFCNRDYLKEHPPATLEKFSIERAGVEIECRLWFPPDFDPSRQYPLVLDVHGGPNSVFYDTFVPVQQMLATAGHLVLAVNPRGSSSYGLDFMMAVVRDWGGEDYLDQMAAVDEVASRPYVDKTRLGVHGYSYGGYMTSWIVGHTDRFKAAVVGAPVTDLVSFYGTSDIGVSFGDIQWGGSLAEAAQEASKHSPITYVSNVKTPVLLLHGEADLRCPIGQSEQFFVALKRLGKEVEMVRFPDCSHLFLRTGHPKMREEYLARTLDWFERYLS